MLINFNHIKTLYNALVQKMKGFRGNWEQNDPTADDYIKNRTHWSEIGKTPILDKITLTVEEAGDQFILESAIVLEAGKTYEIAYNNTIYECEAISSSARSLATLNISTFDAASNTVMLGNVSLMTGSGDTGEPFVLINYPGLGIIVFDINYETSCTLGIYYEGEIIHKLDKKFIDMPDGIVTEDSLPTILNDTLAPVSFTNDYDSLSGKPTIYTDVVRYGTSQSLTASQKAKARDNIGAGTTNYDDLNGKPCYEYTVSTLTGKLSTNSWYGTAPALYATLSTNNTYFADIVSGDTIVIKAYASMSSLKHTISLTVKQARSKHGEVHLAVGDPTLGGFIGESTGEGVFVDLTGEYLYIYIDQTKYSTADFVSVSFSTPSKVVTKALDEKFIPDSYIKRTEQETYNTIIDEPMAYEESGIYVRNMAVGPATTATGSVYYDVVSNTVNRWYYNISLSDVDAPYTIVFESDLNKEYQLDYCHRSKSSVLLAGNESLLFKGASSGFSIQAGYLKPETMHETEDDFCLCVYRSGQYTYICYVSTEEGSYPGVCYVRTRDVKQLDEALIPFTIQRVGDDVIIPSSTPDSTKRFKIAVDDSGTLTATEVI